ncbi:MAG: hypothetical protein VR67_17590 [Peptococcaceae bacterium BRH_c8a]|nr:MAG: hypothetical protein VR67_17590 [Peptococcaceae bacterium BRH_c8a]
MKKIILITVLLLCFLSAPLQSQAAGIWEYYITDADTPVTIDTGATTAAVDIVNHEITLEKNLTPNVVSFWPDGMLAYTVLKSNSVGFYMFDGTQMVEASSLEIPLGKNPLALATYSTLPDIAVATPTELRSYVFDGNGMSRNPALETSGLTNAVSIGTRGYDVAGLVDNNVKYFNFDGSGMTENTILEPCEALNNPLQLALVEDSYDMAILERNQVRYFNFDGAGMAENPTLAVTGLTNPKAFAVKETGEVTVIEGSEAKHYQFDGAGMVYNSALSVSGLTDLTAVAFRPGTWDRVIVDGTQLKYYAFNGSEMVYIPELSVTVNDLLIGGSYTPQGIAQSLGYSGGVTNRVRVRARHNLPINTSVTWWVTADGTNWTQSWRVRNDGVNDYCEVYNGGTWTLIGDAGMALPENDATELWVELSPGINVRWQAVLETADTSVTPKIIGGVIPAVVIETDHTPEKPTVDPGPVGCYAKTTPTITWTFSDPDAGDTQLAYQVNIHRQSDGALIYDSGKLYGSDQEFTLPGSNQPDMPSALWSSGDYQYTARVRSWDSFDQESEWSGPADFCVIALERLRVSKIVSPPLGQTEPDPADPATHIMVPDSLPVDQLPRIKAGSEVQILVDSIGPVDSLIARFPYLTYEATIKDGAQVSDNPSGSHVNRWLAEFWTSPDKSEVPDGTIVQAYLEGDTAANSAYLKTAAPYEINLARIEGSVFEDWMVIIQGRD